MPGHESGQAPDTPPGLTWEAYVDHFVAQVGGWTALADELIRRAPPDAEVPSDLLSVEKGLRRLARRDHRPGGQYGRWMLRFFGVPPSVEDWTRWLAQYHSRFADLPTSLRLEQLRLWDRPHRARLIGQRAYHLTKPAPGEQKDLEGALELFRQIGEDPSRPFVCFRRTAGLAYCGWKLGDAEEGARLARLAAEHAGDGGFVRFRIMALNLLGRMVPPDEAEQIHARAERLARQLEDEDLVRRVLHRAHELPGAAGK